MCGQASRSGCAAWHCPAPKPSMLPQTGATSIECSSQVPSLQLCRKIAVNDDVPSKLHCYYGEIRLTCIAGPTSAESWETVHASTSQVPVMALAVYASSLGPLDGHAELTDSECASTSNGIRPGVAGMGDLLLFGDNKGHAWALPAPGSANLGASPTASSVGLSWQAHGNRQALAPSCPPGPAETTTAATSCSRSST